MTVAIGHSAMNAYSKVDDLHQPSSLIKKLPEDLFLNFCSFLDPRDAERLTFTCKQQRSMIVAITQLYHDELREVANRTFKLLGLGAPDVSNLLRRSSLRIMNRTVSKFSVFFLRTFISHQQASIQLKMEVLHFYVSRAIETSKDVTKALMVPIELQGGFVQSFALRDISNDLTAQGWIEEALEVAGRIPVESMRGLALRDISKALTAQRRMKEALEVARRIPVEKERGFALKDISNFMLILSLTAT